eukprot:TRINITY_DN108870_c0_g1_i1.p1 TRINITY_DN108870_c0_g1~~TRINITY_DN108870_c0_g1_i1.p1  ORF type:complete len:516 (+),score=93.72 TRINITY_DN108870_c0_g1_i1:56-1603(+)
MSSLRKIVIQSRGSRGDIQPYVALGSQLKKSGYDVTVFSNTNHTALVEEAGLAFHGVFAEIETAMESTVEMFAAMGDWDLRKLMKVIPELSERERANTPGELARWKEALELSKPDLLLVGSLTDQFGFVAAYHYGIPTVSVTLQHCELQPERMQWGMPNLPCGLNSWLAKLPFKKFMNALATDFDPVVSDIFDGFKITSYLSVDDILIQKTSDCGPLGQVILCQSKIFCDILYSDHKRRPNCVHVVGQCVVSGSEQLRISRTYGNVASFGDPEAMVKITEFIAAGSKPVCFGWGSMIVKSAEYIMELVIRSLSACGKRGIVQGGWAGLSMDALERAITDESLIDYAKKNLIFVKAAPHEWLFPQCACSVQHGGAGTLAAALRSGVPTVVTPVLLDQWDHAYLVNKLGVGIGFEKTPLRKLRFEDLAEAIDTCADSEEMKKNAESLATNLKAEHGDANAVAAVEHFWAEHVKTGAWSDAIEKIKWYATANKGCCAILSKKKKHTSGSGLACKRNGS